MHQHDICLFEGCIGAARSHGHADVGGCETGCIIDTIAYHCDSLPFCIERANLGQLLFGLQFGANVLELELGPEMIGGCFAISG
jgi:hypothetical protein